MGTNRSADRHPLLSGKSISRALSWKDVSVLFGRTFSDGPDPISKRIQVVDLTGTGQNTQPSFEDFAVYNFTGKGNPIEIAEGPDGSLYLSDIFQGKIFRIRFTE